MGAYTEPPFRDYLCDKNLHTVFEVGSRDALDAINIKSTYGAKNIYVFEPNPEAAAICRTNLSGRNGFIFQEIALWHECGTIPFFPVIYSLPWDRPRERNIGASSCFRDAGLYGEKLVQDEIQIRAETLAHVMHRMGVTSIDLLCIDAQGATLNILKGAADRLNNVRFILAEAEKKTMYEGEALLPEVRDYLDLHSFELVEESHVNDYFGDFLFENKRWSAP